MNQILITHITNLLNLTKEGRIKPKEFSDTHIAYDGITVVYEQTQVLNMYREIIIVKIDEEMAIEKPPIGLTKLFKEVVGYIAEKEDKQKKYKLDIKLTKIIENLYYKENDGNTTNRRIKN